MKSEVIKVKGRGLCILISEINQHTLKIKDNMLFDCPFYDIKSIADEIRRKRKIAAIKEIRHQTGWGLKESKEYSDEYIPPGVLENFDYNIAADRFIKKHTYVMEAEFIADGEMEII